MINQSMTLQSASVIRTFTAFNVEKYLRIWLLKNEHQSLYILFETMKEKGYSKEEIKLAIGLYMNLPTPTACPE